MKVIFKEIYSSYRSVPSAAQEGPALVKAKEEGG